MENREGRKTIAREELGREHAHNLERRIRDGTGRQYGGKGYGIGMEETDEEGISSEQGKTHQPFFISAYIILLIMC